MKLILAFTLLSINIALCDHSYAQRTMLSLSLEDKRVADVLGEIEKKSEFQFFYNNELVDVERHVSVKVRRKPVFNILDELFSRSDITYTVVNKDVILTPKNRLPGIRAQLVQQLHTVSGLVTDENTGVPMQGVSVLLKGQSGVTVTDPEGKYAITVPDEGATLIFVFMGYTPREEAVGERRRIDVVLSGKTMEMEEVVAIGYGTVKRTNLGGAVGSIDRRTFEARPVRNAANALQGAIPGLTVIRTSGAPGSSPTIRVRDVASINQGSPLVLIDGAEGDLNQINPADIENISVLKDGTAAIYGARAASGVILVTTRSAHRNQDRRITFDAFQSVKTPAMLRQAANLYQHAEMALEIRDGSFPIEYTQEELQFIQEGSDQVLPASSWGRWSGYPKFYKDQDWNDMIIGNGSLQNYNLGLSGGGEKHTYLVSLGHTVEQGLPKFGTDNDKRYFVRAKSTIDLSQNLQYDFNLSYEAANRNYSSAIEHGQNIWELIYKTRSWAPLRNPAGNFYTFEGFDNPAQVLEEGGMSERLSGNFTFNNQLTWKVFKDLNLVGRAVVRKFDEDRYIMQKMLYSYNWDNVNHRVSRNPNSAERNYAKTLYRNFTLYADYKKTLGQHDIGVMVGTAHESSDYDTFLARRINFDQQAIMPLRLGSPEDQVAEGSGNQWTINSFFSRVNYAFAGKYLFEATLRADGSSRFDPSTRWGFFPGVNFAWRASEEPFLKNLDIFDDLKFRASYGEVGNQTGIGYYDYIERVAIATDYYPFGSGLRGQMARQDNMVSLSRTWETVVSQNLGADFTLLRGRLFGSFDYFWKVNKDMLIPITYPSMLGMAAPATNSGRLEVKGWEASLGWRDQAEELSYSVRANVGDARNTVASRIGNNLIGIGLNDTPLGYPMSSYFGYKFDGIIQNEQQLADYRTRFPNEGTIQTEVTIGDAMYKDLDGDGRLTALGDGSEGAGDAVYLGNTNPRYTFGLNLNASYKGFDLSGFVQGVGSRTIVLSGEASMPFYQPWFQSAEYWYGKTWTPERTDSQYPAITMTGKRNYNYQVSTNTTHNVAYIRLKNVQLGYTIPSSIAQRMKIEKIRFFFSGEDLFEIHNAPGGWDPEEGGGYVSYPFARNYALGVSLVF
ncbi:TonB-dependent receptor [Sphingobacterium alkalisoli]|uniref:TonB-dependent receptor n=1 Tax=Sphingobacterium alkalisoli TaxID=1874115 RepID=A0A4U0H4T3_9SPHI|nr:TonB-dependent receptor [Sphingobacterium alkalisoli]TJY66576.1 TonB-dependent receptor [Sphingobacterium alkalisoli]GGH15552.1 SusC/RagA family TonB-linked outer membrane protein [Sphingobacterium alkalisoli]